MFLRGSRNNAVRAVLAFTLVFFLMGAYIPNPGTAAGAGNPAETPGDRLAADIMNMDAGGGMQGKYGDVNNSGKVDIQDAILVLRHIVGLIDLKTDAFPEGAFDRARVNGDEKVSVGDGILILRYIVGLITAFPVETAENGDLNDDLIDDADKAPAFSGTDMLTGERIVFPGGYENRAVYLVFFSINCKPCLEGLPRVQNRKNDLTDIGVDVIVIAAGNEMQLKDFWQNNGIDFATIIDSNNQIFGLYEIIGVPTYILVDARGRILNRGHQFLSLETISDLLE